jgi:para-nitrobenzyl esterase
MIKINRRQALGMGVGSALTSMVGDWVRAGTDATAVTPVVKTSNGPIVGYVSDGVQTFRGVRYGVPPVGALRFAPPKKPDPWRSTSQCLAYQHSAIQLSSGGSAVNFPGDIGPALFQLMEAPEDIVRQSEDCLFLNVWTPQLGAGKPRAVMVWLHGGGFNYGSGSWSVYDGHNLAKNHDVVVVTVNHRLNAFGYLYLGDAGDPAAGNVGMLDLVATLEWVRDNIGEFGGDPCNVTIFGQSGGGAKVSTLLAMPAAQGLIHRAIIESGPGLRGVPKESALANTKAVMKSLGVLDVRALQEVPADKLLAAASGSDSTGALRWGPVVDGMILKAHPFDPIAPAQSAGVPVLIGCTKDEATLYNVGYPWWGKLTQSELVEKLKPQFGDKTDRLIAAFRKLRPTDSPSYLYTDVASAAFAFMGSITLAERKAAQNAAPVYMYIWEWGAPLDNGIMRAPHTMEIPFAFDNVDKGPILLGTAESTKKLGKEASSAWTAFARTGDPNKGSVGLPHWPAYDAQARSTMMFDVKSRIEADPYGEVRKIMQA